MRIAFIVILFFNGLFALAQKQSIKFSNISTDKGLSHSNVTTIVQDKNGFMWFGTKEGLNKYDGYTFTVYKNDPDNVQSLSNNFIQEMVIGSDGNLWIGSWGGLSKFDLRQEVFTQYKHNSKDPNSIPNDLIASATSDDQGNLWLGTEGGLVFFDILKNKFTFYTHDPKNPESLSDNFVRDIFIDHKKRIWIGTFNGGLNQFDPVTGKFKRFVHAENDPNTISNNCVYTIFEDSHLRLWIGTHKKGFDLFNPETNTFKHFKHDPNNSNSLPVDAVTYFEEDADGYLWIGTENGGISIYNPETGNFNNYEQDEIDNTSLSNNSIYSIFRDKNSNMWIGSYAGGINFLNVEASKFTHYKHNSSPASLSNNNVLCIFEDSKNNLWIGTDGGGANIFDRKTNSFRHFKKNPDDENSLAGNYILSIAEDSSHNIWFGTYENGVSVYNPETKKFKNFLHDPLVPGSMNCNIAWTLYNDKAKNMWVGTYRGDGLDMYDSKKKSFVNYRYDPNHPKGISNNYINSLFEDSKGNFWIGTNGGGLNLYDKKTDSFTCIKMDNEKHSLSSNNVDCVFEDSKGNLWVGTDLGLNLMDAVTKRFTTFSIKDGMPDGVVFGILEDNQGHLWISTTKGLTKFNPSTKTFINYTTADGLQSTEFKPHAYCKTRSGRMYFGGVNGFNEFTPDSLNESESRASIFITDFKIFNKSAHIGENIAGEFSLDQALSETENIVLSYNQSYFSFEFASLNFTVPEKNQYAYMLSGFDQDWNYIGNRRLASYTNIPPGTYTFRVKGSHNDGKWKEMEHPIVITITPPFWQTWWFELVSGLSVIGIALSFYSYRITAINNQKEALEKIVQERTVDLREATQEIKTQRDSLRNVNEHVMSSINYANSIQKAILTTKEKIQETIADCFIIFKPKDVVSGDFYWFSHLPLHKLKNSTMALHKLNADQNFIAAIDCTGHGVAGAFMSIIGNTLLNEIVNQKNQLDPAAILECLDEGLKKAITPIDGINIAGMDVCLCKLERESQSMVRVSFAGARRPLFYIRKGSTCVEKINGDIVSIGSDFKKDNLYSTKELLLQRGSILYLTTDGFADQSNPNKEKFGTKNLEKLIETYHHLPLTEQKIIFQNALQNHQGDSEQRDDITLIAVRV